MDYFPKEKFSCGNLYFFYEFLGEFEGDVQGLPPCAAKYSARLAADSFLRTSSAEWRMSDTIRASGTSLSMSMPFHSRVEGWCPGPMPLYRSRNSMDFSGSHFRLATKRPSRGSSGMKANILPIIFITRTLCPKNGRLSAAPFIERQCSRNSSMFMADITSMILCTFTKVKK